MKIRNTLAAMAALTWACLTPLVSLAPTNALAGDGHNHDEIPVAMDGPALPRFAAVSETFELVGIVNGKQLTLYLDRFADGAPVEDARLELELGGEKVAVEFHADDGLYEATLAQELKPGEIPVTATVMVGDEADLLAGELDLHDAAAESPIAANAPNGIVQWAAMAAIALVAVFFVARRWQSSRAARIGGAA